MHWVTVAAVLTCAQAGGPAVLQLDSASGKVKRLPALFAEWSTPEERVTAGPLVHYAKNPTGCGPLPRCRGCALFVFQGNCSFAAKARRAESAAAGILIVASNKEGPPSSMAAEQSSRALGPKVPRITALMVSKSSGRQVLLAIDRGETGVTCWSYDKPFADLFGEFIIGCLAVGLVILGAWNSVADLRNPGSRSANDEEVLAVEESSGFRFVIFGSILLTVLFFLMKYLIYVLLFLFATGAVSTTSALLEPCIASRWPAMRKSTAYRLPQWLCDIIGTIQDHTWSDALAESVGWALAIAFLVFRNNVDFGWILQDAIAIMLVLTIQRTLRVPNLKVGTLLLVCTFFFDIFWVFLSPLIFKKSVMIEVATGGGTGQSVPMVLKIPSFAGDLPGQFKILGLGDIAIPGLVISLLLRHDLVQGRSCVSLKEGYFAAGIIGYALGLLATFVSLYLMKHGQPALLFLVPGVLLPTFVIAHRKGEFKSFWQANYSPEEKPEGYQELPGEFDKQA